MAAWQMLALLAGALALALVSRRSLLRPRSHGFYRFFAWTLIWALFLLNLPHWLRDWAAWHQLASWGLLAACLLPLWLGVRGLRQAGRPDAHERREPELLALERTTKLITSGVYRYIRHPLYSSLFILAWGIFMKDPSWAGFGLAAAASLLLVATARADESECMGVFGPAYREYMRRTKMFIPYVL